MKRTIYKTVKNQAKSRAENGHMKDTQIHRQRAVFTEDLLSKDWSKSFQFFSTGIDCGLKIGRLAIPEARQIRQFTFLWSKNHYQAGCKGLYYMKTQFTVKSERYCPAPARSSRGQLTGSEVNCTLTMG
jgi:hypothetical protein